MQNVQVYGSVKNQYDYKPIQYHISFISNISKYVFGGHACHQRRGRNKESNGKNIILLHFPNHTVETLEHSSLDFEAPFNYYQAEAIEDDDNGRWTDDEPVEVCLAHDDDNDPEYKRKAVSFWKQGVKKYRKLSTVQHNFRLVCLLSQY